MAAPKDSASFEGKSVTIDARGARPIPRKRGSITKAEIAWRTHLVESAAEAISEVRQLGAHGTWLFTLDIECFTSSRTMDLDNLPKPILDTLFSPGVPNPNRSHLSAITGVVFPESDDVRVMQLNLRKTLIDQGEEGVVIQVCWSEPAPHGEPPV